MFDLYFDNNLNHMKEYDLKVKDGLSNNQLEDKDTKDDSDKSKDVEDQDAPVLRTEFKGPSRSDEKIQKSKVL